MKRLILSGPRPIPEEYPADVAALLNAALEVDAGSRPPLAELMDGLAALAGATREPVGWVDWLGGLLQGSSLLTAVTQQSSAAGEAQALRSRIARLSSGDGPPAWTIFGPLPTEEEHAGVVPLAASAGAASAAVAAGPVLAPRPLMVPPVGAPPVAPSPPSQEPRRSWVPVGVGLALFGAFLAVGIAVAGYFIGAGGRAVEPSGGGAPVGTVTPPTAGAENPPPSAGGEPGGGEGGPAAEPEAAPEAPAAAPVVAAPERVPAQTARPPAVQQPAARQQAAARDAANREAAAKAAAARENEAKEAAARENEAKEAAAREAAAKEAAAKEAAAKEALARENAAKEAAAKEAAAKQAAAKEAAARQAAAKAAAAPAPVAAAAAPAPTATLEDLDVSVSGSAVTVKGTLAGTARPLGMFVEDDNGCEYRIKLAGTASSVGINRLPVASPLVQQLTVESSGGGLLLRARCGSEAFAPSMSTTSGGFTLVLNKK